MNEQHEKQLLRTKIWDTRVKLMDVRLSTEKTQPEIKKIEKELLQVDIKAKAAIRDEFSRHIEGVLRSFRC